ncbi:KorB domain protein [compost metagenome]
MTSNNQLKLKPVELGRVYLSLRDEHGMSRQEIAREVGRSLAHVDQMILLVSAKAEVIAAVEGGVISATEAVKLARDHGDDAPAELERRVEAARESGKEKVTAKVAAHAKKSAATSRPKVDFVVSCAVVLVNSLQDVTDILDLSADSVLVNTELMADLISAVREMQQAGKPLDADKQIELAMEHD